MAQSYETETILMIKQYRWKKGGWYCNAFLCCVVFRRGPNQWRQYTAWGTGWGIHIVLITARDGKEDSCIQNICSCSSI